MSKLATIKAAIKTNLDALKTAGTLGEVISDDFTFDPIQRDVGAYPVALINTPSIASEAYTNRDNIRTYTFDVVVIQKAENVSSATEIETLIEAILDSFDNDPTLGGAADGAIEPTASAPAASTTADQTYIWFTVQVRAKASIQLTF